MLQLKNIKKSYINGDEVTNAVCGVDLTFGESELVSICGPSGCGKTTLLNIIGGLDKYSSGDLLIDGRSTKTYSDSDWDGYRNAQIGFIFQSYNLITHLTVLDNVTMALSLSGVGQKERVERAKKALCDVGLEKQINKKPNQLSGGQMQRVAIARALVNDPKIILADEPTGALDSKTSVQLMEILKEISKERLVVMVTHSDELANKYSTRIIHMLDGSITSDTKTCSDDVEEKKSSEDKETKLNNKKTKMSFFEAIKSSFKNLMTKKGRTICTSLAGSIGIIGVALILAISSGMTSYVSAIEQDSLAGFPITISESVSVMSDEMHNMALGNSASESETEIDDDTLYSYDSSDTSNQASVHTNVITQDYLDFLEGLDSNYYSAISYTYDLELNVVAKVSDSAYKKVDNSLSSSSMFMSSSSVFSEIPDAQEFIESQYDLLGDSKYPTEYNELALIVDEDNNIDTSLLEALGIDVAETYSIDDLLGTTFKVIANDEYYVQNGDVFVASSEYESLYNNENAIEVSIVAVMRVNESASSEFLSTGIGYTTALTEKVLDANMNSDVVLAQQDSLEINVLTGLSFSSTTTYDDVIGLLGGTSMPTGINIYPVSYDYKEDVKSYLDEYNVGKDEDDMIVYTDMAETITSTISEMISTITLVLSILAGVSLVVSSVMIGIITYVSVVERTKEIGIMRAIGARKKDISRIFNAEAIVIGAFAGLFGTIITYLLCIPATAIASSLIGSTFTIVLPVASALALVALSVALTFIAGLIPSRMASKKDPVVALRCDS